VAIERAISETGYVVNRAARSLVTQRTGSVAMVLSEPHEKLFEDPNYSTLIRVAIRMLAERDLSLVMMMAGDEGDRERVVRYVRGGHADGVLLVSRHAGDPPVEALAALPAGGGGSKLPMEIERRLSRLSANTREWSPLTCDAVSLGSARVCVHDEDMVRVGTSWRRSLLLAASVLLPVAVAVASNQILNDGVWNWWWIVIAVALTAASALVTYALTRTIASGTGGENVPPSPPSDVPRSTAPPVQPPPVPGTQVQLNMPTGSGTVQAVQGGTMNNYPSAPQAQPHGGGEGPSS
jgi:hypothetical protein